MTIDLDAVARLFDTIASDPAQCARMRLAYPEIGKACATIYAEAPQPFFAEPCPEWGTLSTQQLTIYDNHLTKNVGNRWAATLKVFEGEKIDFNEPAWQASAFLWPKNKIKSELRQICRARNVHPFPEAGRDEFNLFVDNFDYDVYGILKVKEPNGPSFHFAGHYVGMKLIAGRPAEVAIYVPGMTMLHIITDFDTRAANGRPLAGRAVAQSRQSSSPELFGWVYPPRGNRGALI
jgi:hypothetical protein